MGAKENGGVVYFFFFGKLRDNTWEKANSTILMLHFNVFVFPMDDTWLHNFCFIFSCASLQPKYFMDESLSFAYFPSLEKGRKLATTSGDDRWNPTIMMN